MTKIKIGFEFLGDPFVSSELFAIVAGHCVKNQTGQFADHRRNRLCAAFFADCFYFRQFRDSFRHRNNRCVMIFTDDRIHFPIAEFGFFIHNHRTLFNTDLIDQCVSRGICAVVFAVCDIANAYKACRQLVYPGKCDDKSTRG